MCLKVLILCCLVWCGAVFGQIAEKLVTLDNLKEQGAVFEDSVTVFQLSSNSDSLFVSGTLLIYNLPDNESGYTKIFILSKGYYQRISAYVKAEPDYNINSVQSEVSKLKQALESKRKSK